MPVVTSGINSVTLSGRSDIGTCPACPGADELRIGDSVEHRGAKVFERQHAIAVWPDQPDRIILPRRQRLDLLARQRLK